MSFWERWFGKKRRKENAAPQEGPEQDITFQRDLVNFNRREEREEYLRECLSQIAAAERELKQLEYEYTVVTSHLTDMEELEHLPAPRLEEIQETAGRLSELEKLQTGLKERKNRISEEDFAKMERLEEGAEEGIQKLQEAEEYQRLVKSDLRRLGGEKHAYEYRQEELEQEMKNAAGMAVICFAAMGACLFVLLILQLVFEFNTKLGYAAVIFGMGVIMIRLFLSHNEARRESGKVRRDLNRLILLQNTVKIRYVNNKNLLDYLCLKYHVKNAGELKSLWERYQEEKEERAQMEQTSKDYLYYQKELLRLLRLSRIRDTSIWLHQTAAILDKREMVELRHSLLGRRKALRDQIDYNKRLAEAAQAEVTDISREYPRYRDEILGLIEEYERKSGARIGR